MQMVVRQLVGDDLVIKDVAFCVIKKIIYSNVSLQFAALQFAAQIEREKPAGASSD